MLCRYIEQQLHLDSCSEAEMISDDSDLDLEPGEIPSTKSKRYSLPVPVRGMARPRMPMPGGRRPAALIPNTVINKDEYGSSSDDDLDIDSDESMD